RQTTVDALQADLYRLFEVSERTVDHVRSIAGAKEQVSATRAMLENVLELVGHAHDAANGLDHRKRQIEQAEERLGRGEALPADLFRTSFVVPGRCWRAWPPRGAACGASRRPQSCRRGRKWGNDAARTSGESSRCWRNGRSRWPCRSASAADGSGRRGCTTRCGTRVSAA